MLPAELHAIKKKKKKKKKTMESSAPGAPTKDEGCIKAH